MGDSVITRPIMCLLVEDSATDTALVTRALAEVDPALELTVAPSLAEAKRALAEGAFDLVLLDLGLPDSFGLSTLQAVRQVTGAPIVVITAHDEGPDGRSLLRAGAQESLVKGHVDSHLHDAILNTLERSRLERELAEREAERHRADAERQLMTARLAQSDRLASMGMLAAGVAHEINNPLAYVLYNLESVELDLRELAASLHSGLATLRQKLGDEVAASLFGTGPRALSPGTLDDLAMRCRDALEGAHRIKSIVRGLSTFSRVEDDSLTPVDLTYAIECAINMSYNEIKYRARLEKDYEPGLPFVRASEGRASQIVLNLLVNAAHAIEEGDAANNRIRIRAWTDADTVIAEVSDTGRGIPAENLTRIFEPFFTTKPRSVGSGLGLPICRNLMAGFGGDISIRSTVDVGTSVTLRFPVWLDEPSPELSKALATPEGQAKPATPRGRLLVIDDEAGIRTILKRLLGGDHDVVAAASGAEAIAILERDQAFDQVLCDLLMERVSGMDVHAWLAEHHPRLATRMVFLTGGAFTPRTSQFLEKVDNPRVDKPFDSASFKRLVGDLVRASRTRP